MIIVQTALTELCRKCQLGDGFVGGCRRAVGLDLRVGRLALVTHLRHVPAVSVDRVGHLLQPAIGQRHVVTATSRVPVPVLIRPKVVAEKS